MTDLYTHRIRFLVAILCWAGTIQGQGISEQPGPSREVIYLSGTDNTHTRTWEFYCTGGRRSGEWTTIEVPSCWEQQGFGTYNYGRDYVTYGRNFRYADEKGLYRYRFPVPRSWKGRKVRIVFEGSMTDTEVRINGEPAGETHRGAFYCFGYDVSGLVRYGEENLLEVTVSKMSSDPSVNGAERYADYWIFGGIFRPVYLESFPGAHISHVTVWGNNRGKFEAHLQLESALPGWEVEAKITDPEGNLAGTCSARVNEGNEALILATEIDTPRLWTAETPDLYCASFFLQNGNITIDATGEKFGFRSVEIRKGDGIYLNGQKIKMKGINRHAFWPETGRTLNRNIDLMDVQLMKEMNMNAVRCSHYPPDRSFLDICDSLGLYVLDELAGWQNAYGTEAGQSLVREMVLRDLNHPSIIFWSNGNEGGTNKELDPLFLEYDPTGRQVIHCHHRPGNDFNGIETNHYESYQSTAEILKGDLIYMTTEFLHAQNDGGGGAGLHDYWELMVHSKMSGGGFIWALLDEGVVRTDLNGAIDVNLVNAPDGVLGPHREKEGSFFAIRHIFSPVRINMEELPASFHGAFSVENRYDFTSLDRCEFRWELIKYPAPQQGLAGDITVESGKLPGPPVENGGEGTFALDLPAGWREADALKLEAYNPHGQRTMEWVWPVGDQLPWLEEALSRGQFPEVSAEVTDSILTLSSNGISISFDTLNGMLSRVVNNGGRVTSFRGGPVACSGPARLEQFRHYREGNAYCVEASYSGDLNQVRWKMFPGGWVELDYNYTLSGEYDYAGISFDFEEKNVMSARWLGEGPYRVWKNRMEGSTFGVWEKAYNNTMAGSPPWDFPEFKGYHARVGWMELNTLDGKILIANPDYDLFVRLFEFYALPEPTRHPALPPGDLSFLDAIPATGTKMSTKINAGPETTGPHGQPNRLEGTFSHTLYFNFGILP
jgi:hypothetical protein